MRTEDAIIRPLLRIRDVAARGALYGLAAVPLFGVASYSPSPTSYPLTMSLVSTSSPVRSFTRRLRIRSAVPRWSWWKWTVWSSVAL